MSEQSQRIGEEQGGRKSDPTALTTDALQREIAHLTALLQVEFEGRDHLYDRRFESIDERFDEVEGRRAELKVDNQREVSTALTATNAAIAKTEQNTKESLQQMNTNLLTEIRALRRDNEDLKTRVTIVEAIKVGAKEDRSGLYATIAAFGGVILLAISVLAFLATKH